MYGKRFFNRILFGLVLVFGISAVTSSGIISARANSAVFDLNPQLGIKAVIAVPDTGLTTDEGGGTDTFDVSLDTDPGGPVTVTLTSSDTAEGTVSPATMGFDSGDYNIAQTATVTGVDDDIDDGDQPYTIDLTSSEGDISVAVTNQDDDPTPTVSFTTDTQSEAEDIGTMIITADLSGESGSDVSVPYTLSGSATEVDDYSIDPNPLVITAGNLTADLTITVVDDDLDEDDEDVVVTMGTPVNADAGATTVHTATITDNDLLPTVAFTADAQAVAENIGTTTITAELSEVSGRDVTVNYILSGSTATEVDDYSIAPNPLIITAGSLSADLTITVVDDADDGEGDEDIVVEMDTLVNADFGAITIHTTTISDIAMVTFSAETQEEPESIGTMTLSADLSALAGVDVTVPYTLSGSATEVDDYTIAPNPLVITAGSLSADLTITVVDDDIDEGNEEDVVITMGTPVNADPGATTIHTAIITDDDTVGITVDPIFGLLTKEDGSSDTFTVVLDSEPTDNVSLQLNSTNTTEGIIDKSSLTFTPSNWDNPKTVTVTGVDDTLADDDITYNIIIDPATSADLSYAGIEPLVVEVTNSDDETSGFTIIPKKGLWTTEGGITAIMKASLKSQPTSQVTLDFSSNRPGEGTVSPTQIIVNPGDWATVYEIVITGVDDTKVDGDISYKVNMESTSADPKYDGKMVSRNVVNYDAPTIEWVSPVGDGEVLTPDTLKPVHLKVKRIGQEPIIYVRFEYWDPNKLDPDTGDPGVLIFIKDVDQAPYETIFYPDIRNDWVQIFATAYGPEPGKIESIRKHIWIDRRIRFFLPAIFN